MNNFVTIFSEWEKGFRSVLSGSRFERALREGISIGQYKSVLREIYFHARENPQIQTLATVYFRGDQRRMIKKFFLHATSEIGHDQMALDDLRALQVDVSEIPHQRPLPATTALLSFPFYQIQFGNPVGYLGYLFHLEFMPTQNGRGYLEVLENAGIPKAAMTFLEEHVKVDVGHNQLMKEYIAGLVTKQEDIDAVVYAAQVTAKLYVDMLSEAIGSELFAETPRLNVAANGNQAALSL